jgi:hypothetical protein
LLIDDSFEIIRKMGFIWISWTYWTVNFKKKFFYIFVFYRIAKFYENRKTLMVDAVKTHLKGIYISKHYRRKLFSFSFQKSPTRCCRISLNTTELKILVLCRSVTLLWHTMVKIFHH